MRLFDGNDLIEGSENIEYEDLLRSLNEINGDNNVDTNNIVTNNDSKYNFGSTASGIGQMLPRAFGTLYNWGNALGWWGEDELDKRYEELVKERDKRVNNVQFSGSNASLNAQSTMMPVIGHVDADDFGNTTDSWKAGMSGFSSGAAAGSGLGPVGMGIAGATDMQFSLDTNAVRNARLGKSDWWSEHSSPYKHAFYLAGMPLLGEGLSMLGVLPSYDDLYKDDNPIEKYNKGVSAANKRINDKFNYAITSTDAANDRRRLRSIYSSNNVNIGARGGYLEANGASWPTGTDFIDNGGSHNMNPFGGVQYGIADDGAPNLVEQGEVVINLEDNTDTNHMFADGGSPNTSKFVISDKVLINEKERNLLNKLTDDPDKYIGKSYAYAYRDLFKKNGIDEKANNPETKDYLKVFNSRFAEAQEMAKDREDNEAFVKEFNKSTPEDQRFLLQQAIENGYIPEEEAVEYAARGGKIHIKPENRGKFTATKKRTGKTTEELTHSKNPLTRKRAIFAQNARRWSHKHPDGGYMDNTEWVLPLFSAGNVVADIMGDTNTPDYRNADVIGDSVLKPTLVGYNPTGDYVKPLITDNEYIASRLANQGISSVGAIKDLSGSGRAAAMRNILTQNYLTQQATGEALAASRAANNKAINDAIAVNNAIDLANAEGTLKADLANQNVLEDFARRYADAQYKKSMLKESIDNQVGINRSTNYNTFLENLGAVYEHYRNRDLANMQYGWSGYQYTDSVGKTHLQYNNAQERRRAIAYKNSLPKEEQDNIIVEPKK